MTLISTCKHSNLIWWWENWEPQDYSTECRSCDVRIFLLCHVVGQLHLFKWLVSSIDECFQTINKIWWGGWGWMILWLNISSILIEILLLSNSTIICLLCSYSRCSNDVLVKCHQQVTTCLYKKLCRTMIGTFNREFKRIVTVIGSLSARIFILLNCYGLFLKKICSVNIKDNCEIIDCMAKRTNVTPFNQVEMSRQLDALPREDVGESTHIDSSRHSLQNNFCKLFRNDVEEIFFSGLA